MGGVWDVEDKEWRNTILKRQKKNEWLVMFSTQKDYNTRQQDITIASGGKNQKNRDFTLF